MRYKQIISVLMIITILTYPAIGMQNQYQNNMADVDPEECAYCHYPDYVQAHHDWMWSQPDITCECHFTIKGTFMPMCDVCHNQKHHIN